MSMIWSQFIRWVLITLLLSGGLIYTFILVLDPYQNVPFSPDLPRAPVSQNQRYAYPALARDPRFDSAIIGTSMVRLLKPSRLDTLLGTHFVSLAMNDATPHEQVLMNRLFAHHHQKARFILYAMDDSWCARSTSHRLVTVRGLPEFMYDESVWNDLIYLFNDKALENAVRMLELLTGQREPKYGADGYADFSNNPADRELALVRERIYGTSVAPGLPQTVVDLEPAHTAPQVPMAELNALPTLLDQAPTGARVVLIFPPMHLWGLNQGAENYRECKARVLEIARRTRPDALFLDLMLDSAITREDGNYLDRIHYVDEVALMIEKAIAQSVSGTAGKGIGWVVR